MTSPTLAARPVDASPLPAALKMGAVRLRIRDAARSLATAIEKDPLLARTHAPLAAEAERLAQDP